MLDRRLVRCVPGVRRYLAASAALGTVSALALVGQAWALASLIVAGFQRGSGVSAVGGLLESLAACVGVRALTAWLTEVAAFRAAASVKSSLRSRLLEHAVAGLGPAWLTSQRTGSLVTLATRGIDAVDGYFARYLPQVVLSVTVPVTVLAVLFGADWESGVIVLVTLPLIPLFMALVGMAARHRVARQRRSLDVLAGHFLDVVAGLPDLLVFGRARAQAAAVRRITDEYRVATLRTLQLAFLSSLVLELAATISVAMVAVGVGLRLVSGSLDLRTGLLVLILAPEAYWPLRQVGAFYHASAEGVAAAGEVFAVLETCPAVPAPRASCGGGIVVRDLTVVYPERSSAVLSGFSLEVAEGECVALVGPSGVGKSTVLKALLGFVGAGGGSVAVGGPVAWLPQKPYLVAGTVGENVRLGRPEASEPEVWAALREAGAAEFVAALPGGLAARVGERGHGLSAGQRQRIGLARVFLADRPVVLLDEPTAGLDAAGEAEVAAAVRRLVAGRTAVVVAHRTALVGVADRVVEVGCGGAVVPVVEARGDRALASVAEAGGDRVVEVGCGGAVVPVVGVGCGGAVVPVVEVGGDRAVAALPKSLPSPAMTAAAPPNNASRLALAIALAAAALASSTGLTATASWLIARASQQPPILYLMVAITAVRALGIGRAAFRYAERLVAHDAAFRVLADLRACTYDRLTRLAPDRRRGDLLARFVGDVDAVQDRYLRFLVPAAAAATVGIAASAALAAALPAAALATALGLAATGIAVPLLAAKLSAQADRRVAPAKGDLATEVLDLLQAAPELIAAGTVRHRLARFRAADKDLTRAEKRTATTAALASALTTLTIGATIWAAAYLGIQAVHAKTVDALLLAVIVLTPLALFEATAAMPQAVQHLHRARAAEARVREITEAPDAVQEPADAEPLPSAPHHLTIRNLTVTWPGRETQALEAVDLDLPPGKKVAIVGPSGAGKTTLISALLRFVDPTGGTITLNGRDTRRLAAEDVRRIIGLCAQDAHIFDSTLRENLRLAEPEATPQDLDRTLEEARLADWTRTLPNGLDTFVGEHGAKLSGGQHRRLALARALLADFPILLLDEPTEHLDPPTAEALLSDLLALPRTTVLVTHRLTGLEEVDEILVLDRGRVVERGTWRELMEREGVFHSLCSVYA